MHIFPRSISESCAKAVRYRPGLLPLRGTRCVDLIFGITCAVRDAQGLDWDRWHISFENGYRERWQYLNRAALRVRAFMPPYAQLGRLVKRGHHEKAD